MSSPFDDVFDAAARQAAREERIASMRVSFQELAVKQLLKLTGLMRAERGLRQACADQTGARHLLFRQFLETHPSFPVWLAAKNLQEKHLKQFDERWRLPPSKSTGLPRVYHNRLVQSLFDLHEQVPIWWEQPVGLVFRRYHYGRMWKIIHNADHLPAMGWRQQVCIPVADKTVVLTVQDFDTFVSSLRWQP